MPNSQYLELINVMDALIDNPNMFFVVVNAEGIIISISDTLLNLLGIAEEQALGKYVLDVIPDGKLPEVLKTGRIVDADVLMVNGHKTIVTRIPIFKNGEIIGAVASSLFMDISGVQNLVDKFSLTDPNLDIMINGLIDSPTTGYIAIDINGIITHINHTYLQILGMKRETVIGRPILDITPHSKLPETMETGMIDRVDVWSVNETNMLVNRLPIKKNGKIIGAIGNTLVMDTSVHQFLIENLQETDSEFILYEGLIESPYTGFVIVDERGYITKINDTMLNILHLQKSDVIGKYVTDVMPSSKLHEILATGRTDKADVWYITPGQNILVNRLPIRRNGKIIGAIGSVVVMDMMEIKNLIKRLQETQKELNIYKEEVRSLYMARWHFEDLIGQSSEFFYIKTLARQFSQTSSTLLITGESGTGKELFAQAVHNASARSSGPFIRINCAALPENLLESELFGYEEGAFTGAKKGGKPGKFELARSGTIFLDEIGDMPMNMQTKLLSVLQERVVERVGGTTPININVRVIAATNRNLEEMITQHEFREDLYYRLNVVQLKLPPLRNRMEDLPILVEDLISRLNSSLETSVDSISEEAMELLHNYSWPGNVRELENLLERGINLAHMNFRSRIEPTDFPSLSDNASIQIEANESKTLAERIEDIEKQLIMQTLAETGDNKSQAAKLLGMHSSALYRKLNKYGLS